MIIRLEKTDNDIAVKFKVLDKDGNELVLNDDNYMNSAVMRFYTTTTPATGGYTATTLDPRQGDDWAHNTVYIPNEEIHKFKAGELMVDVKLEFKVLGVFDDNIWDFHKIIDTGYYIKD